MVPLTGNWLPCTAGDGLVYDDDAHFPHDLGCGFDTAGSCTCDTTVHPGCCPDCEQTEEQP